MEVDEEDDGGEEREEGRGLPVGHGRRHLGCGRVTFWCWIL